MKSRIQSFLAVALLVLSLGATPMVQANCSAGACPLVWSDEFNGSSLDNTKWSPMIGDGCNYGVCDWGNNEEQYYLAENAVVSGGNLTITAKQQNFGGKSYTSARLRTLDKGDWKYGRFEMRAKLPVGQGMWPAFWMLPSDNVYGGWPLSGEIDIMETVGHEPAKIHGTIHYGSAWPNNTYSGGEYNLPQNDPTSFHVYAVEWEEYEIRWYVDGNLYSTKTQWHTDGGTYPAPFDQEFHLLLNLAVGGDWPGSPGNNVLPQQYVIDYVRVYELPVEAPSLVFDDMEHGNPYANGWFKFDGDGGGGLDPNSTDLPPADGGNFSIQTGWGSGGNPGYFGGFGRYHPLSIPNEMSEFRMWINPNPGQDYNLDINLKEDDTGDSSFDDEFTYGCAISPDGPCAVAGGGWQLVTIPLADFTHDPANSTQNGNGVFDPVSPANGGNGELKEIVMTVFSNTGADVEFRTDYWTFHAQLADADSDGVSDGLDNCTNVANPNQVDADNDGHGNFCDADYNNDCVVNAPDLALFKAGYITTDPVLDLNNDGVVNSGDLSIFKGLYFGAPGASAPGALCN